MNKSIREAMMSWSCFTIIPLLAGTIAGAANATQITGIPVMANPHAEPSFTAGAAASIASDGGSGGYGVAGTWDVTLDRVTFAAWLGVRQPRLEFSLPATLVTDVGGYAVIGFGTGVRLVGRPDAPFAASAYVGVGLEDGHRVAVFQQAPVAPSRSTYVASLVVGWRAHWWNVTWEPWLTGGVRVVRFDLGQLPRCAGCFIAAGATGAPDALTTSVKPGGSAGVDLWFGRLLGLRVAADISSVAIPVVTVENYGAFALLDDPTVTVGKTERLLAIGLRLRTFRSGR